MSRKMPSEKEVVDFWESEFDSMGIDCPINKEECGGYICFACGWKNTERAHILAVSDGGSNEVSNIHLLCKSCHGESEYFKGELYWKWFLAKLKVGFKHKTELLSLMA